MPTPFPGMDPYLERRGLWEEVHTSLIAAIQRALAPLVQPRYRVAIGRRVYVAVLASDDLIGRPDVLIVSPPEEAPGGLAVATTVGVMPRWVELPMPEEIIERFLQVRDVITGEVITVIEILSYTNKLVGEGRERYERKRLKVIGTAPHLVEIDLLRTAPSLPVLAPGDSNHSDYRIIVSRAQQRPRAALYLFSVRGPIPDVPIPLRAGETEVVLPLNQVLHGLYDEVRYDLAIDYQQPPVPPLEGDDARWARDLLQQTERD